MAKQFVMIFAWLLLSNAHAVSFSADAVQIRGDDVSQAKMYWRNGNVRFEYVEDGVEMAQVFDNTNNKVLWLDTENKLFLRKDMPEAERLNVANKANKNNDPCKQFNNAECMHLKKTVINGRKADKWLITLKNKDNDFHIFQWIDEKYKNILRQQNDDGTGLIVEVEEGIEINGRKVRKLTMMAYTQNGEQRKGIQWYDNELDIVIKQQYQSDVIDELKNIKIEEIDAGKFAVPASYQPFDEAISTAQQSE